MALLTRYSRYGLRPLTNWETMQSWRMSRSEAIKQYANESESARNALATAWTNNIAGITTLATQAALQRVQTQTKAKIDTILKTTEEASAELNKKLPSKVTLDSGSKVDIASGTLTLSNGTIIDVKTGLKKAKVNVTA